MIKKIIILLLLTLTLTIYASSSWRQVTKPTYPALSSVFFLNENLGWIAGSVGIILRTTDGGQTWEAPVDSLPVIESMKSIYFVDENIGYAGGKNGLLLKTHNGGITWVEVSLGSVGGYIRAIYFSDENIGWVMSGTYSGGEILYTNDGGISWEVQVAETSIDLESMSFYSPGKGICVGGNTAGPVIYYTSDGITWNKAPIPTGIPPFIYLKNDLHAVAMASETVACATGWGSSSAGLQPAYTIRTTDGGANWRYETQTDENKIYVNMYGMDFKDANTGIAVGGNYYKGSVAYKTVDGGVTWKEINFPMGFSAKSISIVNDKICVVGSLGIIALSDDFGETWKSVDLIPYTTFYVMKMLGEKTIIAAGYGGVLLKSTDYGETWKHFFIAAQNVCPTVEDLCFLDENVGFAAQKNRTVSKTIDGGKTWTQIMKDTLVTAMNNYGVQFLNEDLGFVVGQADKDVSAFYKTTDGGTSWTSFIAAPNLTNELNVVHFFDENKGVVAGDESVLAYTEDGGLTWTKITPNNIPAGKFDYYKIKFLNDSFGLIAGQKLIKSSDAGKTWEYLYVPNLPAVIHGVDIVDELTWYLSGDGFLLKTVDGGNTWGNILDTDVVTASSIYDVVIDSYGYPWLTTGSGVIYTEALTVGVKRVNNNIIDKFSLETNYPNPFNPSTKIRYSIPFSSVQNVELKVYDVLGQEVATLVNEAQKFGSYEVEFNASKLSSGIYIYTLRSAGLLQSRKMLLIK